MGGYASALLSDDGGKHFRPSKNFLPLGGEGAIALGALTLKGLHHRSSSYLLLFDESRQMLNTCRLSSIPPQYLSMPLVLSNHSSKWFSTVKLPRLPEWRTIPECEQRRGGDLVSASSAIRVWIECRRVDDTGEC
jgi:hypothetical protein